jgi:hypothetical protein
MKKNNYIIWLIASLGIFYLIFSTTAFVVAALGKNWQIPYLIKTFFCFLSGIAFIIIAIKNYEKNKS